MIILEKILVVWRMRTTHSPQEKVKVAGEVMQGLKTVGQIAADHNLSPNMV
jgi:transposase-like protein